MVFGIALRYLFAKKSHKAVNVISLISMAGVAVATTAIVVVLSVFNGFSELAGRHLSAIDPELLVCNPGVKAFGGADSLCRAIGALEGVGRAYAVLEERALLEGDGHQMAVRLKGVDTEGFGATVDTDALIIDGVYSGTSAETDSLAAVQLSVGVAVTTGLRPSPYTFATIYMPRRTGRINPANPASAYRTATVGVSGVYRVDQPEYDTDGVLVPIWLVRSLLEYGGDEASSIAVYGDGSVGTDALKTRISAVLPQGFTVYDRMEQHTETFRMIAVEKWVTFLMLVCILLIASFNIVSTLSLLVIEKRQNMATLRAMGAGRATVSNIFVILGWLITAAGALCGTAAGVALSLLQEHFGLIKLNGDPSALTIDVYPVSVQWSDILLVLVTVSAVGLGIAQISRIFTRKLQ